MQVERTLSIIKPDAVAKNVIGEIYSRFEQAGLRIVAAKMKQLSRADAEEFYAVHRERPFFADLVAAQQVYPQELLDALWELVWAGHVTNDTFAPLRSKLTPPKSRRRDL